MKAGQVARHDKMSSWYALLSEQFMSMDGDN